MCFVVDYTQASEHLDDNNMADLASMMSHSGHTQQIYYKKKRNLSKRKSRVFQTLSKAVAKASEIERQESSTAVDHVATSDLVQPDMNPIVSVRKMVGDCGKIVLLLLLFLLSEKRLFCTV